MNFLVVCKILFSASKEIPLVSAASPKHTPHLHPIAVDRAPRTCPAPRTKPCLHAGPERICSLSVRNAKPLRPPVCRIFLNFSDAGQQLVDVALMADVPQIYPSGGKDLVHGNGQFYDKIRSQMPAGSSQCADQFRSHFRRQFFSCGSVNFLTCAGSLIISSNA